MESSGSCSRSAAPTFPANTSLSLGIAIREEENKLGHKKALEVLVEGAFKCKLCPRSCKTARARGGHQNAHRQLRGPVKKQKAHKVGRRSWSPAGISPSSYATTLRSACLRAQPFSDWRSHYDPSVRPMPPSFPWQTGTGGVAPAILSAPEAGFPGTRDGINLGRQEGVREENQDETANGIDLSLKL